MDKRQEELISRFHSVHNEAVSSKDVSAMRVASSMFIKTFEELVSCDAKAAQDIIECYEGNLKYNNFLTESETDRILSSFVNEDGTRGAKWRDYEDLFHRVKEMGGKVECEPYFNKWALYVAMNKAASSQHSLITKWVGDNKDKYVEACYELALTQLKDKSKPNWVRSYYGMGK